MTSPDFNNIIIAPIWKRGLETISSEEIWEYYEKCLKAYDWLYESSDSIEVQQAGEFQTQYLQELHAACSALDQQRAEGIRNRLSPRFLDEDLDPEDLTADEGC